MSGAATRLVGQLCLGVAVLASVSADAAAQLTGANGVQELPSPAVFGGARPDRPSTNSLSASINAIGGYDTNVLYDNAGLGGGGAGGGLGSTDQTASTFAGGSTTLSWNHSRPRMSSFGSIGASYRTFFDIDDYDVQAYDLIGGMRAELTQRSSLSLGASVAVQPFFQTGVLGGGLAGGRPRPVAEGGVTFLPDNLSAREQVLRFAGHATYQYRLGPRTSFNAEVSRYGFRPLNDTAERSGFENLGSTYVGARLTRTLTTALAARLGYGYTWFDSVATRSPLTGEVVEETAGMHNIDVGLDYTKALTFARRTSFSFGTGTTVWRRTNDADLNDSGQTQVSVNGFATLQRQFLRTWAASLYYTHNASYLEGYNEMVLFDRATASIAGLFADRLDAGAGVSYTNGGIQTGVGGRAKTLGAGAQLRYGFTPSIAAFVSYTYARSDIPDYLQPINLVTTYRPDRQGVRVGLTVWFDLLR